MFCRATALCFLFSVFIALREGDVNAHSHSWLQKEKFSSRYGGQGGLKLSSYADCSFTENQETQLSGEYWTECYVYLLQDLKLPELQWLIHSKLIGG
jgi:hypothetical protein